MKEITIVNLVNNLKKEHNSVKTISYATFVKRNLPLIHQINFKLDI